MASLYRNMEEFSKSYVCFKTYCMHLLASIIDYTNIGRNVRYQIALLAYSYCSNIQDNLQSSNTSLITSTNCAIYIHYLLFLLHVSLYHTPSSGRTHMPPYSKPPAVTWPLSVVNTVAASRDMKGLTLLSLDLQQM
jgi:hypothetical protein